MAMRETGKGEIQRIESLDRKEESLDRTATRTNARPFELAIVGRHVSILNESPVMLLQVIVLPKPYLSQFLFVRCVSISHLVVMWNP